MTSFEAFAADLLENPDELTTKKSSNEEKFPCPTCAGTGKYQGPRVHQQKSHCFSCRGKGYFKTDPRKLKERRMAAAANQAQIVAEHILEHEDFVVELSGMAEWNDFARSLLTQLGLPYTKAGVSARLSDLKAGFRFKGGKVLSENQLTAGMRMVDKINMKRELEKAEKAEAPKVTVDLQPIRDMFETAVASGYKAPSYRAEGLKINRAPDHGRNPGALYVKDDSDEYLGKILGNEFFPTRNGEKAKDLLAVISGDPLAAALRYGQRTGRCACCGRELTNHGSIEAGIGPICREKWGF